MTNFEKIIQNMTIEDYAADRAFHQVCHDERGCPVERIEKGFINARGRFTPLALIVGKIISKVNM